MNPYLCTFRLSAGAVECDVHGARVAGFPLLIRGGSGKWKPRPSESIERALMGIYGVGIDAQPKVSGLAVVAEALNHGELARAQIATLLLKLPDPGRVDADGAAGLRKLAILFEAGWLSKEWDPSKHPRAGSGPNPGWFAPNGGGAEDGSKPAGASDAAVVPVAAEEDERFPWEERDDEGGEYFNPETLETRTIRPGSGIVLRGPWIRLDDLPTQTFLRAPATETWVNPSSLDRHYIDHADEFGATSPEDYAERANEFYEEAQQRGYRMKVDTDGTVMIYDPMTNIFGSYTGVGRTITFLKPDGDGKSYFDRQPGILRKLDIIQATGASATREKSMSLKANHMCPVCGYPSLEEPPRSETNRGSFEICPCCGFEFGYTDEAKGISYEEWRRRWIAKGMPWSARSVLPPPGLDRVEQLRRLLSAISKPTGPSSSGNGD